MAPGSILQDKAKQLDATDPLKKYRALFELPSKHIYLCNNSLGLPAKATTSLLNKQISKWSEQGAHGWFSGEDNWYTHYDEALHKPLSIILGAHIDEVVVMNSLTINLHLLLTSFYQPTTSRYKIVIDAPTFPSDLYAIKSHLALHKLDPQDALIILRPRDTEHFLRIEDVEQVMQKEGQQIALVFLSTVNYLTGQVLDISRITKLAQQQGCLVGVNLAHAAGNIPLQLHDQQVDFAVGCSYKYLCGGPGGQGFAYIHSSHHHKKELPRLSGWWGNDPATRFQVDRLTEFVPFGGANSWQVSTPSILAVQPLLAALQIYCDAGMTMLRKKSELQTAYLLELLATMANDISIITPLNPDERGCQLSIVMQNNAELIVKKLIEQGIICDFRSPNVIRVTPSPLYNTFEDIYHFAKCFGKVS